MSLIVEDGTGRSDAESYVSLANCKTYADNHGLTFVISGDDAALAEQALRRATVWLDATYGNRFPGYRTRQRSQALQWPRTAAWDNSPIPQPIGTSEIPVEIINACCEAAVREKASPGALSPDLVPSELIQSASVSGAVSVTYAAGSGALSDRRTVATVIDDILASILSGSRGPLLNGSMERV